MKKEGEHEWIHYAEPGLCNGETFTDTNVGPWKKLPRC